MGGQSSSKWDMEESVNNDILSPAGLSIGESSSVTLIASCATKAAVSSLSRSVIESELNTTGWEKTPFLGMKTPGGLRAKLVRCPSSKAMGPRVGGLVNFFYILGMRTKMSKVIYLFVAVVRLSLSPPVIHFSRHTQFQTTSTIINTLWELFPYDFMGNLFYFVLSKIIFPVRNRKITTAT